MRRRPVRAGAAFGLAAGLAGGVACVAGGLAFGFQRQLACGFCDGGGGGLCLAGRFLDGTQAGFLGHTGGFGLLGGTTFGRADLTRRCYGELFGHTLLHNRIIRAWLGAEAFKHRLTGLLGGLFTVVEIVMLEGWHQHRSPEVQPETIGQSGGPRHCLLGQCSRACTGTRPNISACPSAWPGYAGNMIKILLTGFEPFGGDAINPSLCAVEALALAPPDGTQLATAILPVAHGTLDAALDIAIARARPDVVLACGLAGSRAELSVERVAINIDDARIPYNDGAQPVDQPVVPGGPAAYFATVPIKAMVHAMRAAGVPAAISQTAGTFGCNHVFYRACHQAAIRHHGMRVGFIHMPALPDMVATRPGQPSMSLATIIAGLTAAIIAVRDTTTDLRVAEGATH